MPAQEKSALRIVVPIVVGVLCASFILLMLLPSAPPPSSTSQPQGAQTTEQPANDDPAAGEIDIQNQSGPEAAQDADLAQTNPPPQEEDPPSDPASSGDADPADSSADEQPSLTEPAAPAEPAPAPTQAAGRYRARPVLGDQPEPATIGSLGPDAGFQAEIAFTTLGAGVRAITLSQYYKTIDRQEHYELQGARTFTSADTQLSYTLASLSARQISIDGQSVEVFSDPFSGFAPVWRETGPGVFECLIVDQDDTPVVRLQRAFSIQPGSYEISVRQTAENLTDRELRIRWVQYGPIDLPEDQGGYRLKIRRVRFGYLWDPRADPTRQIVHADSELRNRESVIDRAKKGDLQLWPRPTSYKRAGEPVWLAQTSRYFAFAVHPLLDEQRADANLANPTANPLDKSFALANEAHAITLPDDRAMGEFTLLTQLTSSVQTLGAGQTLDLSFAAYAGPLGRRQLHPNRNPVYGALGLDDMVIYNIGGPCAFCTFQWLAKFLILFLSIIHDHIVYDWALAIMLLVVCVRTLLHPITKRSQIGIMRFSKQMQKLAPKQQKLREKFRDDPKRLNQEMLKLMREEGVSYTGMLGCLPMFLQTPIWIALYAMLYFSFDLRHEAAFFGVFQSLTGGAWPFLADLSSADNFIPFGGASFSIPLMGDITGFNILPILLGFVFFVQQKYMTPPPSATMTPEQQAQQRMIKVMMVVMMPVFLYNAPSGLSIYFITNSMLGILESRYIRAHVDKEDLEAPEKPAAGSATAAAGPGKKKVASKAQKKPASPFKKDRTEYRREFKDKKKGK